VDDRDIATHVAAENGPHRPVTHITPPHRTSVTTYITTESPPPDVR